MDKATLAAETKKLAKEIGKNLKALNHPIPHSVLLHALTQVAGIHDWRVLAKEQIVEPPEAIVMASANCDTNNGRQSVVFNLTPWLKSLDENSLVDLLTEDETANQTTLYTRITPWLFQHTHKSALHTFFEMNEHIADHSALQIEIPLKEVAAWMETQRIDVFNLVLCLQFDVSIEQAEEEEIYSMWDWIGPNGNACEHSFDTDEDAMQNAVTQLQLKELFLADRGWDEKPKKHKAKAK